MLFSEAGSSQCHCGAFGRPVPIFASLSGRAHQSNCRVGTSCSSSKRRFQSLSQRAAIISAQAASAEAPAISKPGTISPKVVNVSLGDRSYPIYIGEALLNSSEIVSRHIRGSQILVVSNETIAPLYLDR